MPLKGRFIPGQFYLLRIGILRLVDKHVTRDINQHRPRPPRPGKVKGLLDYSSQRTYIQNKIVVLGNRQGNTGGINFLEGVLTDKGPGYLTGYRHYRHRVQVGIGNAGYQIGGSWTGGSKTYTYLATGPGVAVGGMGRPLLVAHQNMAELGILGQGIIQRYDHSPG